MREQWTPELDDMVRAKWGKLFAREIGLELGRSKNAVIGRAKRLGLPEVWRQAAPKPQIIRRIKRRRWQEKLHEPPAPESVTEPLNIGIFDLEPSQCRFPCDGQGYKTLFCGHPAAKGLPYCPGHCSIAYP
jgi:GcrA cell cycle regulator